MRRVESETSMAPAVVSLNSNSRFSLLRGSAVTESDFAEDVRRGLSGPRKSLPPRWFYDSLGSALFDAICFLPEYYVMRAEAEVLEKHGKEIAAAFGPQVRIVELGSGLARKTRLFLDDLTKRQPDLEYVPVDVDEETLERVGRDLLSEYEHLRVLAVASDFTRPSVPLRALSRPRGRTVVLFLGSTIGNLDPEGAVEMLRDLRGALAPGDALFLGADLRKSKSILEPAYDDPLGVTAAFNLNLLVRINRELGGHFDLNAFRHRAFYDEELGRIEMHLVSLREQSVRIDALGMDVAFDESETIHTESSHKYDDATLAELAEGSGFTIEKTWTDEKGWFADVLMVAE
jgi:L-histidine N-alpha-methyltransferase